MAMETLPYPFATSNTNLLSPAVSSAERMEKNVCTALVLKVHTWVPLISFFIPCCNQNCSIQSQNGLSKNVSSDWGPFPNYNCLTNLF